jgi:hypothetical protein
MCWRCGWNGGHIGLLLVDGLYKSPPADRLPTGGVVSFDVDATGLKT